VPADLEGLADLVHLGKASAPSVAAALMSQK
jgi:hypothetical protein